MSFIRESKSLIKALAVFSLVCLCGCTGAKSESKKETQPTDAIAQEQKECNYDVCEEETDLVRIDMADGGIIVFELYPDIAPITVKNFKKLVGEKFYDGLIFHRVIKDFMIQTGDPTGTGYYGSSETIKGEFGVNGFNNSLDHTRGVVSMARANDYDSASSQFFIIHADYPSLNGNYAAFGKVVFGMDTVDKIATTATGSGDRPLSEQKMLTVRFAKEK